MMLSEYLPADKVDKCVLIDKAWPMCHSTPQEHHIHWDHIYGNKTDGSGDSYFTTWPIPLHTSKQDLKPSSTMRQLAKRYSKHKGPILVLGVHLCGTLSIQAVKLFQDIPTMTTLMLKPCCLPGKNLEIDHFQIGKYAFPTKQVCASGKWSNKEWKGPPRWHLQDRFDTWCYHLQEGMKQPNDDDKIRTRMVEIPVQTNGGYQNTFLFAEKEPTTPSMWKELERREEKKQRASVAVRGV
jgi:hypothetical protein